MTFTSEDNEKIKEILSEILKDDDHSITKRIFLDGQYYPDSRNIQAYLNSAATLIGWGMVATSTGIDILRIISNNAYGFPAVPVSSEDSITERETPPLILKELDMKTGKKISTLTIRKNAMAFQNTKGILLHFTDNDEKLKKIDSVAMLKQDWKDSGN